MLPSKEIRGICDKARMAVARRGDSSKPLEEEFQVPAGAPVFLVLDARGELLAKFAAGDVGAGCTKETVAQFPRLVAERLESSLARSETREGLERAWAREGSPQAGAALAARLEEQRDFRKLADLCEALANRSGAGGGRTPEAWLLKGLQHRAQACFPPDVVEFRRLVESGGRILSRHPETPEAVSAVALVWRGCSHGFDVPSRSARAIQDLEARGAKLEGTEATAFRARMDELKALRDQAIKRMESLLEQARTRNGQPAAGDFHLAWLGDAEAGVRLYGKPAGQLSANGASGGASADAYREAMRDEAREKLKTGTGR